MRCGCRDSQYSAAAYTLSVYNSNVADPNDPNEYTYSGETKDFTGGRLVLLEVHPVRRIGNRPETSGRKRHKYNSGPEKQEPTDETNECCGQDSEKPPLRRARRIPGWEPRHPAIEVHNR